MSMPSSLDQIGQLTNNQFLFLLLTILLDSPEFKKLLYTIYVAIIFWAVSKIANIRITWNLSVDNTHEKREDEQ